MSITVLGVDPGETTGMMLLKDGKYHPITVYLNEGLCRYLDVLESLNPSIIVMEKFQLSPSKSKQLAWNTFHTCEVIGIIKMYAEREKIPVILHPSSTKAFSKVDDKCPPGCSRHEKDAYMHLWYFLRNDDAGREIHKQLKEEALA